MDIKGINHFCFSVADLERSIAFYEQVFDAKMVVKGRKLAYFDLHGLWIALNQEDIPRDKENRTYTHIAFTIEETDFDAVLDKLRQLSVEVLPGRERDVRDKKSIYGGSSRLLPGGKKPHDLLLKSFGVFRAFFVGFLPRIS